ncbi:hypothetical protein IAU60_005219 [Kwoniella sp. DSM 27419]
MLPLQITFILLSSLVASAAPHGTHIDSLKRVAAVKRWNDRCHAPEHPSFTQGDEGVTGASAPTEASSTQALAAIVTDEASADAALQAELDAWSASVAASWAHAYGGQQGITETQTAQYAQPTSESTTDPAQQPEQTGEPMSSATASATGTSYSAAPAATTGSSSTGDGDSDSATFVDFHNQARAKYGAGPVTWNDELATYARQHASVCGSMTHTGGPYGENLAAGTAGAYDVNALQTMWMSEAPDYDPSNPLSAGHFTQVVWQGTTEIGCAAIDCPEGTQMAGQTYVMCEYKPQGNIIGEFEANVGRAV